MTFKTAYFLSLSLLFSLSACSEKILKDQADGRCIEPVLTNDFSLGHAFEAQLDKYEDYERCVMIKEALERELAK